MLHRRRVTTTQRRSTTIALLALGLLATASMPVLAVDLADSNHLGRMDFDFSDAPPATVELDLSHGMLADMTGIGQAAIMGVVDGLRESADRHGGAPIEQSAEHLAAVHEIVTLLSGMVHEVRIRVYEDLPEGSQDARQAMIAHYEQKLDGTDWENVVRVHDDDARVIIGALRSDGAIRGLFIIASEDDELVMVNAVCQLTPEKVRQVTQQSTKIGMKFGLDKAIRNMMEEIQREAK